MPEKNEVKLKHAKCHEAGGWTIEGRWRNGAKCFYWMIIVNGKCVDTALNKKNALKRAKAYANN